MIPIGDGPDGRPFIDYLLSSLADAGFTDVCLVIGPEHTHVRERYERETIPSRLRIHFAIQERALGTANAVLSAELFAENDSFVVINSDNYYPREALEGCTISQSPRLSASIAMRSCDSEMFLPTGRSDLARSTSMPMDICVASSYPPTEEMLRVGRAGLLEHELFSFHTGDISRVPRSSGFSAR
jgi:UTP-glucose-1-phosphate uridylyltransferase